METSCDVADFNRLAQLEKQIDQTITKIRKDVARRGIRKFYDEASGNEPSIVTSISILPTNRKRITTLQKCCGRTP